MAIAGPGDSFCHAGAWDCGNGAPPRLPRRRQWAGWGEVIRTGAVLFQGFWAGSWWDFGVVWWVWWIFGEMLMDFDRFLEDFDGFFGKFDRFWWILSSILIDWLIGGTGFVLIFFWGEGVEYFRGFLEVQQIHLGLGTTTSTWHDWDHWRNHSHGHFSHPQHPDAPLVPGRFASIRRSSAPYRGHWWLGLAPEPSLVGSLFLRVSHQPWPWPGIRSEYSLRYSNFHWKSRCSLSFTSHGVTIEWWHQKWQHQPGVVGCQWESNNWGPADCRLFTDRFPNQGCPFIAMFDYPETMSCVWPGMG